MIGFTVTGTDYVFSPDIRKMILTNPDVEHIDNYATFTIDGYKYETPRLIADIIALLKEYR